LIKFYIDMTNPETYSLVGSATLDEGTAVYVRVAGEFVLFEESNIAHVNLKNTISITRMFIRIQ
jgi:hypothetical protein